MKKDTGKATKTLKHSTPDELLETRTGRITLDEKDLNQATGGALDRTVKIKWTTTTKTKVETFE